MWKRLRLNSTLVERLREQVEVENYRYKMAEKERDEQKLILENNPEVEMLKARLLEV